MPGKKVVFSLDYDGCSCVIYPEPIWRQHCGKRSGPAAAQANLRYRYLLEGASNVLRNMLIHIASIGEETEVFCGSNRQSRLLDKVTAENGGAPGSALDDLQRFCKEQGWTFNPFLLVDHYLNVEDGASFANQDAASHPDVVLRPPRKLNEWDPAKCKIISEQLKRVAARYPEQGVEFYFFDDDRNDFIFPALKFYFKHYPAALPAGIRLHFVKYDWQQLYGKPYAFGYEATFFEKVARSLLMHQGGLYKTPGDGIIQTLPFQDLLQLPKEPWATPSAESTLTAAESPVSVRKEPIKPEERSMLTEIEHPINPDEVIIVRRSSSAKKIELIDSVSETSHPSWAKYETIWNATRSPTVSGLAKAKAILLDYAMPHSCLHREQPHCAEVRRIADRIDKQRLDALVNMDEVVKELNKIYLVCDQNGSIARRIRFIASKTVGQDRLSTPISGASAKQAQQLYGAGGSPFENARAILKNHAKNSLFACFTGESTHAIKARIKRELLDESQYPDFSALVGGLDRLLAENPLAPQELRKQLEYWQAIIALEAPAERSAEAAAVISL